MSASAVTSSIKSALSSLPAKFSRARKSGALYFFDSEVKDIVEDGRKFQICICPALLDKDKAKQEADAKIKAEQENSNEPTPSASSSNSHAMNGKSSPFEPPYDDDLFVGDIESVAGEEGLAMLLNKYAILPEHLLLCSKSEQSQSSPPTPNQLLLTYLTLQAAANDSSRPKRLLAFYNGGKGAGASQAWRHLQCVEVPAMRGAPMEEWVQGLEVERRDRPFTHPTLPYLHIMHHLPPANSFPIDPSERDLDRMEHTISVALMSMLDLMYQALRRNDGRRDGGWNLLMTLNHLHLVPRAQPHFTLPTCNSQLEVNSLAYAGMLLTKSQTEYDELSKLSADGTEGSAKGCMRILEYCGVPRSWGEWEEPTEGELASL